MFSMLNQTATTDPHLVGWQSADMRFFHNLLQASGKKAKASCHQ